MQTCVTTLLPTTNLPFAKDVWEDCDYLATPSGRVITLVKADHCVPSPVIRILREAGYEVLRLGDYIPIDSLAVRPKP